MPVLKTFTSPVSQAGITGGRRADGSDLTPALGDISGPVNKAVKTYADYTEENESRQALIRSSEIRAQYARKLDEAQLSGSDLGKLKEEMTNDLAKVGEGFQTRRGVESLALYTANTELMFDEQANRIAVHRASSQAKLDGAKFLNSESSVIQSNPTYLAVAEQNADAFGATLKGIPPEMRNELVDRLKKEMNASAAIGSARLDPEGTKRRLEGGEWNLTPDQRNAAINKADSEIRAKRSDEMYQRSLKEYEERERDEAGRDRQFKGIMEGKASRRGILDDPDLKPATREHLIMLMEQRGKALSGGENRSNPGMLRDAWVNIASGKWLSSGPIVDLVNAGHVSTRDGAWLVSIAQGQKDESGQAFRSRLNARLAVVDRALRARPDAPALAATGAMEQIELEMVTRAERQANEYRAAGNKDALEGMLDSDSKHYFFTPSRMKQIEVDVRTATQATAAGAALDVGSVVERDGEKWTFRGGDPKNPKNWEPVREAPRAGSKEEIDRRTSSGKIRQSSEPAPTPPKPSPRNPTSTTGIRS